MVVFCFMVLVGSALLAVWMPAIHFGLGLLGATIASAGVACMVGFPVGPVAGWSLVVFVLAQVGYGFGFGGLALLTKRRRGRVVRRVPHGEPDPKGEAPTRGR